MKVSVKGNVMSVGSPWKNVKVSVREKSLSS